MSIEAIEDEVEELKAILERQGYDYGDGEYQEIDFDNLGEEYNLPENYVAFLKAFEPYGNEVRYAQRHSVVFFPLEDLRESQATETEVENGFVFGSIDDHPLVLGLGNVDEFGEDCPVYKDSEYEPIQLASTFYQYLQMFRISLEMLHSLADFDDPLRWNEEQQEESDGYGSDYDDYSADDAANGREQLLEEYYQELEDVDPDCSRAWHIDQPIPA